MNIVTKATIGVLAALAVTACAAETAPTNEAPEASLDTLDSEDEGTSYNGWSQHVWGTLYVNTYYATINSGFTRSYGDATRGGGACLVRQTHISCSDDSNCLFHAQSSYGSSAWGYCYSGACYLRPGDQSLCTLSPNRAAGGLFLGAGIDVTGSEHILGCMTKNGGPNTACGGTNTSLYMRTVNSMTFDYGWP
jgi:hypothetical protein